MEDEFEEIEVEASLCGDENEIDLDYEFDAPLFCDFTRPETFWEALEAEQWFQFASSYPPSPLLLKLRWENAGAMESVNVIADDSGPCMEPEEDSAIENNNSTGLEFCNQTIQDMSNGKTNPLSKLSQSKSKVSRFMKPTASHLAKQKNPPEVQTPRSFRSFQSQNSSSVDGQLTKRQKLEAGYMRKVARLKHQTLFTHKKPKEVDLADINLASKPKVTIPREPYLETALRAQRHKCRTNAESGGDIKSGSQMFKARPLKKKILEAPTQPFHKKRRLRLTKFNVFHFKTSERAMQHTSSNPGGILNSNSISNSETRELKRTNSSDGSRQEKYGMINKPRGSPDDKRLSSKGERGVFRNIKVFPLEPNNKRFLNEPPTELFSKLSLASEVKQITKSPSKEQPISKGLKENRPGSLGQKHEINLVKEEIQRLCGKQYQCMNEMGSLISKHPCLLELGR